MTAETPPSDYWTPIAVPEVAVLCGVERDTINKWRKRVLRGKPFPRPRWTVSNGKTPLWARGEVMDWLATRSEA